MTTKEDKLTKAQRAGIKPLASPEYCPGGYSLHLYCKYENPNHGFREFPWEITECETRARSERAAREAGWIIHRDNTATCPKCAKALKDAGRTALERSASNG